MLSVLTVAAIGILMITAAVRRSSGSNPVTWLLFWWRWRRWLLALAVIAVLLRLTGL